VSKVDRNAPKRSTASEARYSLFEFERDFPDDAAALDYLFRARWPEGVTCPTEKRVTKHYRDRSRPAYSCEFCGHRVYPMAGTIFQDSATSLRLWFYAIYLMASTRCGISAKQIERELGVTYKTAWRMFNKIRSTLSQDGLTVGGTVEMDEAYIGGKRMWMSNARKREMKATDWRMNKTPVVGLAERGKDGKHGRMLALVSPDIGTIRMMQHVERRVLPASTVFTDEFTSYEGLGVRGYTHKRVRHQQNVYVIGEVHTNTVEGFWSLLKRGISGVYHGVSTKHLQAYVDEYVFRYNNRGSDMFRAFLGRVLDAAKLSESPA
jgi:transposase-like protein